jgi:type I restriction enzyme S subunit
LPDGWRFGTVGDLGQLEKRTINPAAFLDETFDHYSIPAFDDGQVPVVSLGREIKSNKTLMAPGCILVSKLNPHIPRVWLPDVDKERRSICSTEFLAFAANGSAGRYFAFSLFTSEPFTRTFASRVTGTTGSHQRVSPQSLLALSVVLPPGRLIRRYSEIVEPLFDRISANRRESVTLAAIRDALLPKLLSGEVRVPESSPHPLPPLPSEGEGDEDGLSRLGAEEWNEVMGNPPFSLPREKGRG